jgi:hypothetical protein
MNQAGSSILLRPERPADAALFEALGEAIRVNIDFDMFDAVTNRTFAGIQAVRARGAVEHNRLVAAGGPQSAAQTALLQVGGITVGVGVDFDVISIVAVRAGHCLTPLSHLSGIFSHSLSEDNGDGLWKSRKKLYKSISYTIIVLLSRLFFGNGLPLSPMGMCLNQS